MKFTKEQQYALDIMLYLAERPNVFTSGRELSNRLGIPYAFVSQITYRLGKARLIESIKGRGGGYNLARGTQAISVSQIFGAVAPGARIAEARIPHSNHEYIRYFYLESVIASARRELASTTLASLAAKLPQMKLAAV